MKRFLFTIILASIFGLFHLIAVAAPFIAARGIGEEAGWRMIMYDFPLIWVVRALHLDSALGNGVLFITVFGTLMYAAVGAAIGYFVDWIRRPYENPVA